MYIHTCMYVCMYIYICIYIHITLTHTHTHTDAGVTDGNGATARFNMPRTLFLDQGQ
jgi:hypothetical protein